MRTSAIVTAGALGLVFAATAFAAPQGPRARLDPNASVTRADTLTMASQRFDRIDANKDGMIDAAEMAAHHSQMEQRRAQRMAARAAKRTDEAAANEAATAARREPWEKLAKARAEARSAQGEFGFAMRDADGDGLITREEFTAPAMKRFDRADANSDGVITPEERAAMRGARRMRRG